MERRLPCGHLGRRRRTLFPGLLLAPVPVRAGEGFKDRFAGVP
ncbi:hypothetical protein HMPREF3038_02578 [Akkermansia sp. KLE1797]|nr:hypothetical protein HMPREF3038_02578 [Akkermansia sp. KLE1797]KXU52919.1 hypothetical protein HMPREF3039_02935 [Akkermansia sp. KLE1798]KZA04480.1 hypothetical protein HMPREF1326_01827 [Akkermansia sp. KLE1605]